MNREGEGGVKPFLDHLEDLRRTLLASVAAFAVGVVIAMWFAPRILQILEQPLLRAGRNPDTFLIILEVMGGLSIAVRVTVWSGLLLSAPFILFFVGGFVFPGLHRHERRTVALSIVFAATLFAAGVRLCYTYVLPQALEVMFWFNTWMGVKGDQALVTDYVSFVLKLLIAFGLSFELPVVILALGHLGVVTSAQLREKRRYVIVGLFVVAMILTPPDPFTQIIMALPMTALYELCIWIIWVKERGA
jgi:sec-independent protein translocase protein TatC